MTIKKLLLIPLFLTPIIGFAQNQEISNWQQIHPNVIFIESSDFTPDFEEKLIALKQEFIVYSTKIDVNDITNYETKTYEKSGTSVSDQIRNDDGNQLIKDWLGQNQTIKIVPRSDFESYDKQDRNLLITENALILAGESLTITDIENYEATH